MDILCPICGEPWDVAEMGAEGVSWSIFRQQGCEAFGSKHSDPPASEDVRRRIIAIYDVMGDDVDGAAVEIEECVFR